jgi:hypothetical protein
MQYYPTEKTGFELNAENAALLQLTEAFDEGSFEFIEAFCEKFSCDEPSLVDTTYERGGYVQGLSGWDEGKEYIGFDPGFVSESVEEALEDVGIMLEHAEYSQLG